MKRITFLMLWVFLMNLFNGLMAQENYLQSKIIPPSPTAAALGAYGDIPVSYFTGTPSITIPLYEISTGQYSLPIDLSYNASTIRVAEDASWVGLGWSLNAGGVITRSIRGLDDLDPMKGYYYAPALPPNDMENFYDGNWNEIINFSRYANDASYRDYIRTNACDGFDATDSNYFMEVNLGLIDVEPDIYYYNFAGYTGSFVMGKQEDGSPILMAEKSNLEFEYIPNSSINKGQWIVTAPDGTKFHFNTAELTEGYVSHAQLSEVDLQGLSNFQETYNDLSVSSWYLDEIEPIKGSSIEFNYSSNSRSLSLVHRQQTRYDRIATSDDDPALFNYFDLSRQIVHNRYLSSIAFENGRIEFQTASRNDIEGRWNTDLPKRLKLVKIFDKDNQLLKEFELGHDYFNGSSSSNQNPYASLRLKLNSVTEYGRSGYPFNKSDPYLFTYYGANELPSKYSNKVDSWGYYNPLIPNVYLPNEVNPTQLPQVVTSGRSFNGIDRKADETGKYSQRGMLKTIIYPTRGTTAFVYEPNRRAISPPDSYIVTSTLGYAFSDDQGEQKLTESFHLSGSTSVKIHLYALATYGPSIPQNQVLGYLKNSNNQVLKTFTVSNPDATVSLSSGTYHLSVDLGSLNPADYDVSLTAVTEKTEYRDYEIVGGNRIKEIKNYDSDGTQVKNKTFIYTEDGSESGTPTGFSRSSTRQHITQGVYFHVYDPFTIYTQFAHFLCDYQYLPYSSRSELYLIRKSTPLFSIGLGGQSGGVGYKSVYVHEDGSGSLGFTKYNYYSSPISSPLNPYYYPQVGIPEYMDPIIGKLKSVKYYNDNSDFLKGEEYIYSEKEGERLVIKGLKIFSDRCSSYPGVHLHEDNESIKFYDNVSKWYVLDSKIITEKLEGEELVRIENYTHDNTEHLQVTKTETTNSHGDNISVNVVYPEDIANKNDLAGGVLTDLEFSAIQGLKEQNRVIPVQQETYKDGALISRQRTLYKLWSNGLVLPKEVKESKGTTGTLKSKLIFHGYDNFGNLQEVSASGGSHTVYLWGYKGQYPIAKIENISSYSSISSSLIDSAITASNNDHTGNDENNLRTALKDLRESLPQAQVTTYTYDPLVGLTSICDSKGLVTRYTYDNFNRLRFIKDETDKLIQENKYSYKN